MSLLEATVVPWMEENCFLLGSGLLTSLLDQNT